MFLLTSMPVGGAETLLVNLVRRLDPARIVAEIGCLKQRGPLGELIASEFPVYSHLIRHKYDLGVVSRLVQLLRARRIDALVTVGAGDKMFWGRIAAFRARLPVIASALHSTGWPDSIGFLNRQLTPITDAYIAVAAAHARHLVQSERLPASKVFIVPNGIDTRAFSPGRGAGISLRRRFNLPPAAPLCVIVAALRPEKNHRRFLRIATRVKRTLPQSEFVVVGDGPLRQRLEQEAHDLGLGNAVHWLGCRNDVADVLAACNLFALTSDNEANPVSIMEAMACGLPVVATNVGSIHEIVSSGRHGFLVSPENEADFARRVEQLLRDRELATECGCAARQQVLRYASVERMVEGYQALIEHFYRCKCGDRQPRS
jgi:glycosyltransferase involved in cell wall biosynthesis